MAIVTVGSQSLSAAEAVGVSRVSKQSDGLRYTRGSSDTMISVQSYSWIAGFMIVVILIGMSTGLLLSGSFLASRGASTDIQTRLEEVAGNLTRLEEEARNLIRLEELVGDLVTTWESIGEIKKEVENTKLLVDELEQRKNLYEQLINTNRDEVEAIALLLGQKQQEQNDRAFWPTIIIGFATNLTTAVISLCFEYKVGFVRRWLKGKGQLKG